MCHPPTGSLAKHDAYPKGTPFLSERRSPIGAHVALQLFEISHPGGFTHILSTVDISSHQARPGFFKPVGLPKAIPRQHIMLPRAAAGPGPVGGPSGDSKTKRPDLELRMEELLQTVRELVRERDEVSRDRRNIS